MHFKTIFLGAAFLALAAPASGSLIITLTPDTLFAVPGTSVVFSGSLVDTDGDNSFLFLTGTQLTFDPPGDAFLSSSEDYFFNTVTGDLIGDSDPLDNTYTGGIFQVDIAANAPAGNYTGTFSILGGYNGPGDSSVLSTTSFQVVVTPEPATAGLLLFPLCGLIALRRRFCRCAA